MDQEVIVQNDLADRLVAALRKDEFIIFRQAIVPLMPTGGEVVPGDIDPLRGRRDKSYSSGNLFFPLLASTA
jgi:hypothetical protein